MKSEARQLVLAVTFAFCTVLPAQVRAETETMDLKALAKKARPAVMLLVVSDADGKEIATGTGFLISNDGKLITNHHVIENAASAVAKAENGGLFSIEGVLADDPKNDLVLLKLKGKDLPFLTLSTDAPVEAGTRIAVVGAPLGLEGTLSEGIVSAVRVLMGDIKVLQVTAAISPGSSGSPVMNVKGDVVGIASAALRSGQAVNFAVPVACVNQLLANVKPSIPPEPFDKSASGTGKRAILADPDGRALSAATIAKDWLEMLKRANVLVSRYPDNAAAWFALGEAYWQLNFTDDAITAYRQAIKIKPDFAQAWNNLGVAYGKSGRTEDAIVAYRQAIKIMPDLAEAWDNLGEAYARTGQTDAARDAFEMAKKLKPQSSK